MMKISVAEIAVSGCGCGGGGGRRGMDVVTAVGQACFTCLHLSSISRRAVGRAARQTGQGRRT